MPAALTMDPPNDIVTESSGSRPADEREHRAWRARVADRERREAALALASGDHKLGSGARCPACRGRVVIGETVRVMHAASCSRRAALARARAAAAAGAVRRRPAVPARTEKPGTVSVFRAGEAAAGQRKPHSARHAGRYSRGRDRAWTSQSAGGAGRAPRRGVRPSVVAAWSVTGCRVRVGEWAATVTGPVRRAGEGLVVPVEFDDGWNPEDVLITFDNGELVTELAACA